MNDLSETYGNSSLTVADLALIGAAMLNAAAAPTLMRHVSPAGMVEYGQPNTVHERIVMDFIAWTRWAKRGESPEGARLTAFLGECGWMQQVVDGIGEAA